jgi:hypothetical protein
MEGYLNNKIVANSFLLAAKAIVYYGCLQSYTRYRIRR